MTTLRHQAGNAARKGAAAAWATLRATLAMFIWNDIRDGMIDLRGFSSRLRVTIWLGFLVAAGGLLLLTQTAFVRATFPLITSATPAPGRGLHIPLLLFPLSIFLLSVGWAYLLVGARQSHWTIRTGALALFALTGANWLAPLLGTALPSVVTASAILLCLLVLHALPRIGTNSPAGFFLLNLLLTGAFFVAVQYPLVRQDQASGLPIGKTILEGNLRSLVAVVVPVLLLVGLDIADFTVHVASWSGEAAERTLPNAILALLIAVLTAYITWRGVQSLLTPFLDLGARLMPYLGTLCLVILLWLSWTLLLRITHEPVRADPDQFAAAAGQVALPLVIVFLFPLLVGFLYLEAAQIVQSLAVELSSGLFGGAYTQMAQVAESLYRSANTFSEWAYSAQTPWQQIVAAGAIAAGIVLARGHRTLHALYTITVGVNFLWLEATRPGQWLEALAWTSLEPVIVAWLLFVLVMAVRRIRRAGLGANTWQRLLLPMLVLLLMGQTNLIVAPLDPLFSLAGVGYLAVGLGWDLLTAGSWANESSPALPRRSRVFLYLGYIILTVMLVNWAAHAHDTSLLDGFTGQAALTGLTLLGYPYLYAVLFLLCEHAADLQPPAE